MTICNDPIGDMLTRIRNGLQARLAHVTCSVSKERRQVLDVLKSERYIDSYTEEDAFDKKGKKFPSKNFKIALAYTHGRQAIIREIKRVSKPGRRVYASSDKIPYKCNGLGVYVISTSRGVVPDRKARQMGVGGEIVCSIM